MTPLHVAASYGDLETLILLLRNGANANLQDEDGNRPLDLAMENGHSLCIEELKIHTMLARVDDCHGYPYSNHNQEDQYIHGQLSYFDNSFINPEVLENKYAKTITQEVYNYLSEGKNICFDATSPTTPLVGLKTACLKPSCNCNENSNCSMHFPSQNLEPTHGFHRPCSPQSMNCDFNHIHHSPLRLGHRSSHTTHSPKKENCNACPLYSTPRANHRSSCLSVTSPRMICELQPRLNNESWCQFHSLQAENQVHHTATDKSSCSFSPPQKINRESPCQPHSPHKINHELSTLNHSPHRINHELSTLSRSPHKINHELSTLNHSPHRINHELSTLNHSPHRINHELSTLNHSPHRINHELSTLNHSPKRINQESSYLPLSTNKLKHGSPCCSQPPQRMNQVNSDFDLFHSAQRKTKGYYNISAPTVEKHLDFDKNASSLHSGKDFHPLNVSSVHPCSSFNTNDCVHQIHVVDESRSPVTNLPTTVCCQKALHPKMDKVKENHIFGTSESKPKFGSETYDNERSSGKKYFPSLSSSDQSTSSALSRVAEYVLSCTDFLSQCSVDDTSKEIPKLSHDISSESPSLEKENLLNESTSRNDISSSSSDSFCTAEGNSISNSPDCSANDRPSHFTHHPSTSPTIKDSTPTFKGDSFYSQKDLSQRWHPPTLTQRDKLDDSSIMTSEISFSSTDRNKTSVIEFTNQVSNQDNNLSNHKPSLKSSELLRKRMELGYSSQPKIYNSKEHDAMSLDNSLFSTITVEELVHTDPESGITLVEKWIPSECGSSIVSSRRSLESLNSKLSQDSQATLIYDWKTLKHVSNSDCVNNSDQLNSIQNDNDSTLDYNDKTEEAVVPLRFKKLSNEQLSQELQKFGEIPGPVIAATRQVYLKRLASLELEPGLIRMTKTCPDYPNELRQAMNGSFDWSGMSDLEMKMVDNFSTSQGRQWREGCVKSSFTYLLLDPRVTSNLPLRAKELSELETFKNFICGIFYIGKGKRARPYCHLYEAASKMNYNNCKMSDKLQHIVDIWRSDLGVISLHCFQSVIPVEAYTREACMLEAIGMHKVTNVKRGDFYGIVSTWPMHQRRKLGTYLLHKAMKIFLAEGERQICVPDLKSNSQ